MFVCVEENNKLTVLNMSLDDLCEHALSVIDLKTKIRYARQINRAGIG